MKLKYIKANGVFYRPQEPGMRNKNMSCGNYPVCLIKKLPFGRWRIDYYDEYVLFYERGGYHWGDENKPNQRLILYPNGIEEISYII